MATFNGEKYIKKQIDSILCQLSSDDEIVVSDDESTDNTIKIIQSYNDIRIKLFLHHKREKLHNKRLASFKLIANNFENTLIHAKGDYIFLSDQDDIWISDKVSVILQFLNKYDMVLSNYSIIDDSDIIIKQCVLDDFQPSFSIIRNIVKNNHLGCCMAFRKEMLSYILPFPENLVGHDIWISSLISYYGTCAYISASLQLYRRHGSNVSSSTEKSKNDIFIKISYRIYFILHFLYRIIIEKNKYIRKLKS
jgi:glycosyltransferase involved in cell wall biosynthesis